VSDDEIRVGDRVLYTPKKGKPREGVVEGLSPFSKTVIVTLDGDPFPVEVRASKVSGCQNNPNAVPSEKKVPKSGTDKAKKKGTMTTETPKRDAKEVRKRAQALGIAGWEDMTRKEMRIAVKRAERKLAGKSEDAPKKNKPKKTKPKASAPAATEEKTVAKKSTKTKAAAKPAKKTAPAKATTSKKKSSKAPPKKTKATKAPIKTAKSKKAADSDMEITFAKGKTPKNLPDEGVNPFRKSSGLYQVAALLLQGGTRRSLAERLSKKIDLHPYRKTAKEVNLNDYDKRLLLGAQTMREQFGYAIMRSGRALDGKILVFRPGGPKDPRGKSKKSKK
jgi:hypothetical protein